MMPKVRALKRFNDVAAKKGVKNVIRKKDDEFEVDEKRAAYLVEQKMVEVIKTTSDKKAEKTS